MKTKKIDDLIALVSTSPEQFKDEMNDLRGNLRDTVVSHFHERLDETKGVITADLKDLADRLYDVPGTAYILADALRFDGIGEVQKLLGRKRIVECVSCDEQIEIFELRKKGGYRKADNWKKTCLSCKKEQQQEATQHHDIAVDTINRQIQIDYQLKYVSDPLTVEAYFSKLSTYYSCWAEDELYQYTVSVVQKIGSGCMVCDEHSFDLYLLISQSLENLEWFDSYAEYSVDPPKRRLHSSDNIVSPWSELTTIAQVLWRLEPSSYFVDCSCLPLLKKPLILLCSSCTCKLAIRESYHKIEF